MSGEIINAGRTLEQVTQGILTLSAQTVANMCQIGKLLTEAKEMVGHGGWGKYLSEKVAYSQSTANSFMRMYEEYGEFGPNSQTIANLGPTKVGLLLALPAEQREQFAEEHQGDSVRQLKAEITRLTKRAEKAEEKVDQAAELMALATEENDALKQRLNDIDGDYKTQLIQLGEKNAELLDKLAVAENREPSIPNETLERIRKEGAAAAMDAQREIIAAAEAKAQLVAEEKDGEIAKLRALLERAQKGSPPSAANPNYGAFKASFENLYLSFQQVCKYAVAAADGPEQIIGHRNVLYGLLKKMELLVEREVQAT